MASLTIAALWQENTASLWQENTHVIAPLICGLQLMQAHNVAI